MKMETILDKPVGELVADDYRTAAVFQKYHIDFCCKGGLSLAEACKRKNLDALAVEKEVKSLPSRSTDTGIDFRSWPADLLIDYIVKKHHRYVEQQLPVLQQFLQKIATVHGSRHPELLEIATHFNYMMLSLMSHMQHEEQVLFPYIQQMAATLQGVRPFVSPDFGEVHYPITRMRQEHSDEGERLELMRKLSDNYSLPEDACNTYRVAFQMLEEFEMQLHEHIHLENNLLFPWAEQTEQQLR
jgi:regulator of cell morphogenesis and NO signaling